jgi:hypothetical protein
VAHEATRVCISQRALYFHTGKACVQRNCNDSQPAAGVHQLDVLRAVREQEGEAITDAKTLPAQCRRNASDPMLKIPEI